MNKATPTTKREARFGFGNNWSRFLESVNDARIRAAEESLCDMLEQDSLAGMRFLDAGSGSGLFSLAARNLGAEVHSFDYDASSVECTRRLKARYRPDDRGWRIETGDVLDESYIDRLGRYDVVYSWGVLHHTGALWSALANTCTTVDPGGYLFVAIYNDQRWLSRYWGAVKRLYNRGLPGRIAVIAGHAPWFLLRQAVKRVVTRSGGKRRGMAVWRDILDWLGGYPFEVARPEAVLSFCRARGFVLERMTTVDGRHGCNEYVFRLAERAG